MFKKSILQKIELILRLERLDDASDLIRARAVYIGGLIFALMQIFNFIFLTYSYGEWWSISHQVCVGAFFLILAVVLCLRYYINCQLYAGFFSLLIFSAISFTAIPDHTGINTTLLPLLMVGSLLNGLICGWKTSMFYAIIALGFIWALYIVTVNAPANTPYAIEAYKGADFQRAFQATIAFLITSVIAIVFSRNMYRSFDNLKQQTIALTKQSEKADMANIAKSEFLTNMSHELRTPMNGIMGMAEILSEADIDEKYKQYASIIHRSGGALTTILNDILDFSKVEAGKLELDVAPFELRKSIEDVVILHSQQADQKGVALRWNFGPSLPTSVIGDAGRIRQVLNNLISNAIKFTKVGHVHVNVSGVITDGLLHLNVAVEDTGIGIPVDKRNSIFEKFTQAETSTTREYGGTGLGLAISKSLINIMGGEISVQSQLGKGSTFQFQIELPIVELTRQSGH